MHVPGYEVGEVLDVLGIPGVPGVPGVPGAEGSRVVHRARRLADDRQVAVRVEAGTVPDERRFREDVRTAGRLSAHPYVVEVHDGGLLPDARPYLVVELCPEGSIAPRAPLPPGEVAEIGQRIADVLVAAHDLGLPHGGVEPGELLVKPSGAVGLAGFGLASLNLPVNGRETVGPRADVRDLAATLYALVTGFPPRDPVEDVPGVSAELMAVLRRGLTEDPARGYPDAAALRVDLSQLTVAAAPRRPATRPATTPIAATEDADDGGPAPARPAASPPSEHAPGPRGTGGRAALVTAVLVTALVAVVVGWLLLAG